LKETLLTSTTAVSKRYRVFTRSSKRQANCQQTSSTRPALTGVFWIRLLEVCWTFAESCKHPLLALRLAAYGYRRYAGLTRDAKLVGLSLSMQWEQKKLSVKNQSETDRFPLSIIISCKLYLLWKSLVDKRLIPNTHGYCWVLCQVTSDDSVLLTRADLVVCYTVSKNIPDIFDCNLKTNNQILIKFCTNISDTTCYPTTI